MKKNNNHPTNKVPTSFDVAKRAGVSQSSVSLVISGKASGRVSYEKEEIIRKAASELGYFPNARARAFRLGKTQTLALVIPDVSNPFFASVLRGAQQEARKNNYVLVLVETENDSNWQSDIIKTLMNGTIDGLILSSVYHPGDEILSILKEKSIVVECSSENMPTILIESRQGAKDAMRYLISLGHEKIAYLSGDVDKETFLERRLGYKEALRASGITYRDEYFTASTFTLEDNERDAKKLLLMSDPPTAIFCEDDLIAVGVYKAAHKLGIKIPEQLSVIGFDDIEIAIMVEPELTTISVPAERIGGLAVEMLLEWIGEEGEIKHKKMPLNLVVRGSTTKIAND